jgi:hypothetical protein
MATIPGSNCAAALVALRLPPAAIVEALMKEVGLDHRQATMAAFAARQVSRDVDCLEGSNA